MISNFNKNPHFPFTYSDDITNNGYRLSDYVVNKISGKKNAKLYFIFDLY